MGQLNQMEKTFISWRCLSTTPEWLLYGHGDEINDDTKVIHSLSPQRLYQ
jgi:hypothetical protein